ncbi:MAG: O-antigen ligase family protein [Candidatus Levybacteria bacterium]|nr:O-antigen ligase family protein [Candidatus Levybacteria bacterium]
MSPPQAATMKQSQKLQLLEKTTYFLILLFLPTQLGKHFWPSWSYVSGLRIDYLSPTIYFTDILIMLLFSVVIIQHVKAMRFSSAKQEIRNSNLPIVGLWLATIVIGILLSKNVLGGFYGSLKLLEFSFFSLYTAKHVKSIAAVAVPLAIGVLFESSLAFVQVFLQGSIGGLFYWFGERTLSSQTPGVANASLNGSLFLRPYATFSHPNVLAGYLIIAMTIVVSHVTCHMLRVKKSFYTASLVFGTLAIFLTLSRVAIVIWASLLIISVFKSIRAKKTIISTLLIIAAIFFFTPLSTRFFQSSLSGESLQLRISLSQNALAMIRDHPIFGVGLYNFIPTLPFYQHAWSAPLFSSFQPVHNIFLLVATETGVLGLIFFAWFIVKTCKRLQFQISNFKFQILFVVLVLGMFDHYFLTLQQGQLLFALVIGLCFRRL